MLRQDPLHPDVWLVYDEDGNVIAKGHLELRDGTVVFVETR